MFHTRIEPAARKLRGIEVEISEAARFVSAGLPQYLPRSILEFIERGVWRIGFYVECQIAIQHDAMSKYAHAVLPFMSLRLQRQT
jgi:hypothetical protein